MDALAVAVRLSKACGYDNLYVTIVVVIRILHAVEQTALVECLTGNITGSLHLAILSIHCYILSCHILELKCPDRKSTTGAPFAKE